MSLFPMSIYLFSAIQRKLFFFSGARKIYFKAHLELENLPKYPQDQAVIKKKINKIDHIKTIKI